jgi:hypothetical protein
MLFYKIVRYFLDYSNNDSYIVFNLFTDFLMASTWCPICEPCNAHYTHTLILQVKQ